jgi:hypothetical protein
MAFFPFEVDRAVVEVCALGWHGDGERVKMGSVVI